MGAVAGYDKDIAREADTGTRNSRWTRLHWEGGQCMRSEARWPTAALAEC